MRGDDRQALTLRLDRDTHDRLRRAAFEQHRSMADVVRDALANALPTGHGCDQCGALPARLTTPGAIRLCTEHDPQSTPTEEADHG